MFTLMQAPLPKRTDTEMTGRGMTSDFCIRAYPLTPRRQSTIDPLCLGRQL